MNIFALDSNIVSYALKKDAQIHDRLSQETAKGNVYVIPVAVYFEVKRWLLLKKAAKQLMEFEMLCIGRIIGISVDVWNKAAELYSALQAKGVNASDDADLLIAALCISRGYTLVTNNIKHFLLIEGLRIENWK